MIFKNQIAHESLVVRGTWKLSQLKAAGAGGPPVTGPKIVRINPATSTRPDLISDLDDVKLRQQTGRKKFDYRNIIGD
jgi:hypothetical protein